MKVRTFILGATLTVLAAVSAAFPSGASAQSDATGAPARRPGMHHMFMGGGAPLISIALRHQSDLNLSSDQVATLEKIRTQYQDQVKPLSEQLRGLEREIAALLQESPANLVQVKLKIEQGGKLRSELRYLRIEALENGKSVLTADQRSQLQTLLASMRENFRRNFHRSQGQAS